MRLKIIIFLILVSVFILISRVYYLSVRYNDYYKQLSKKNYTKVIKYTKNRGLILDRNKNYLAVNKIGFAIKIAPHLRRKKYFNKLKQTLLKISKILPEYSYEKLFKKYKISDSLYKHDYLTLIDYIPYDKMIDKFVLLNSIDILKIETSYKRYYPYKKSVAHIIGYVGKISNFELNNNPNAIYFNIHGKTGLEKYYNTYLNGSIGEKKVVVDAMNNIKKVLFDKKPKNNNLITTIDIKLEQFIDNLMKDKAGAVVVMKTNGEILAAGSYPEFDNNIFVNGLSQKRWNDIINNIDRPLPNKVINGLYPPGSVLKMGVAISFLENKVSPYFNVYCTGSLEIGNHKFRCWKEKGHKTTGFRKAIRESCDDFFYKGSLKIGINKIHQTLDKFGFGKRSGVDLAGESYGINPNKFWKSEKYNMPWYIGETLVASIGQGFVSVTPIQIARYTASIATNKLPTPFLKLNSIPNLIDLNISKRYLKIIRGGMKDVANHPKGTAYKYLSNFKYFTIAAKTGTAQVIKIAQNIKKRLKENELKYLQRSHAWLTTYAPYKNPQIVVTIIIEHGGHGGSAAGSIARKIYKKLYDMGYIN